MAKSSKRRKEKNADFVKPKLKLGKGKQPAANAVDTSFKARTISVPQQSITTERDDTKPTTRRKLSYDDLIAHLKHYSSGVKKDAFLGLRELLEENADMVQPNLLTLLHTSVKLISDEDATVRKSLLTFFDWLLRRVPQVLLVPHSQTLLLFTTSAQTSIFADVRIDAVRLLDLLLDVIPDQVVAGSMSEEGAESTLGHGRKVLDGYLSLLSASSGMNQTGIPQASTSATVMLSPTAKAIVLHSLSKFLKHTTKSLLSSLSSSASEISDAGSSRWYMRSSFVDESSYLAFCGLFGARRESAAGSRRIHFETSKEEDFVGCSLLARQLVDGVANDTRPFDLSRLSDEINELTARSTIGKGPRAYEFISSLCGVLHPILVSTFLDCAPSVFAPSQQVSESEVQLVLSVLEIARCIYGTLLRNETDGREQCDGRDRLRSFLAHLSVYYPFGESKVIAVDVKADQNMQTMNLIYSELFSMLFASSSSGATGDLSTLGKKRKLGLPDHKSFKRQRSDAGVSLSHATLQALEKQSKRVRKYVIARLQGQARSGAQPMGQPFTTATYEGLLPTIWWLLNEGRDDEDGIANGIETFNVVIEHATRIGSTSSLKKSSNEFAMRLVLLNTERHYRGSFRMSRSYSSSSPLVVWLLHLPKVLWEIGEREPSFSELILKFLICVIQRRPIWLSDPSIRVALAARLTPFFMVQHPAKGRIAGPFGKFHWGYVSPSTGSHHQSSTTTTTATATKSNLKAVVLDLVSTLLGASSWRSPSNDRRAAAVTLTSGPEDGDETYAGLRRAVRDAVDAAGAQERSYWTNLEAVMASRRS